jgi:lysosomal alpha-mannosidase
VAYNPLALARTELLRVPVPWPNFTVSARGRPVASAVLPVPHLGAAQYISGSVYGRKLPWELQFAADLGPLGLRTFDVAPSASAEVAAVVPVGHSSVEPVVIENERYVLTFGANGTLETVRNKKDEPTTLRVDQDFFYYEADQTPGKGAGPYMFRPDANKTDADGQNIPRVRGDAPARLTVVRTPVVTEVRQVFADWLTQVVRLPVGDGEPELEVTVGPVPTDEKLPVTSHSMGVPNDGQGKEVVVRYSTGLATQGRWLTDSNGRELLERTRNHRPDYVLNFLTEPQAANMHPIQTAIAVRRASGGGAQLTVTPDRAQAGTSLVDGQIELLVHRRLLQDDGEGACGRRSERHSRSNLYELFPS